MSETLSEIKDLVITILVFSVVLSYSTFIYFFPSLVLVITAVIFHELGHKFVARYYKCSARFRMSIFGILISLVGMLFGGLLFMPGAVEIFDSYYDEKTKKWKHIHLTPKKLAMIALGGVGINIIMIYISILIGAPMVFAQFNILLALFNLIPFHPFDGEKIYVASPGLWLCLLPLAIIPMFIL